MDYYKAKPWKQPNNARVPEYLDDGSDTKVITLPSSVLS